MSGKQVGWLIPEWPRPSHTFFRRELKAMKEKGFEVSVFSTRPRQGELAHAWAREAAAETMYLHPPTMTGLSLAVQSLVLAGPRGWSRCIASIYRADVPNLKERARLLALLFYGAQLAGYLRRAGLDHVHAQFCSDSANVAMFARLLSGVTYSISHHEFLAEFGPNQKEKWRHALFGHTISRVHLDDLRAQLGNLVPADVVVAPMGIEPDGLVRSRPYAAWTGEGEFVVVSCGRQTPGKNQEVLLRALHLLRQQGLNAKLVLAGADETPTQHYRKRLESVVVELGLSDHVTMLGAVGEHRVKEMLEGAHVFALSSLHEGVSVAVMEAMAMEVPVVVTLVGGMADLVNDGVEGHIVPANDVTKMAEALARIARDPATASAMGKAGREKVLRSFHSGVSADALIDALMRHVLSLAG